MRDKPAKLFSPWYTESFVKDKLEDKRTELVKLEKRGEIRDAKEWNDTAQRRFKTFFDRLSSDTKRSYQSSARHFGKYLGLPRSESKVSNIVARLIVLSYLEASTLVEEYAMWMEEDGYAPNTINARLAALRWFVDAARRVGWVEWKLDVKNIKGGNKEDTEGPSQAEFRRILRVVNSAEGKTSSRNKLLVYMLAFMGVRISSAISLDMENIDFENHKFKVRWKGKGEAKAQYVWRPVGQGTMDALQSWLEVRGDHEGPIFCPLNRGAKRGSRLSIRSARKIIREIGQEAATRRPLSPHAFRHFHGTDLIENEADTRVAMTSLGHSNIKTVEHYIDKRADKSRKATESLEKRWLSGLEKYEDEDEAEIEQRYQEGDEDTEEDVDDELAALGVVTSTSAARNVEEHERLSTGLETVDDLLGGHGRNKGIVLGSLVLLGGLPGIGKSTLARQISYNIVATNPGVRVLMASGEESSEQIGEALDRLGCAHKNLVLFPEISINKICQVAEKVNASVLVVDSVSTVAEDNCDKPPGSISQVKAVGSFLLQWCKGVGDAVGSDIAVIVISHVDKKGNIAGPKALEHHVDAVFSFMSPSKRSPMRSLGCEGKNRFGDATKEIFFKMTSKGLVEHRASEDYSVFGNYEDEDDDRLDGHLDDDEDEDDEDDDELDDLEDEEDDD